MSKVKKYILTRTQVLTLVNTKFEINPYLKDDDVIAIELTTSTHDTDMIIELFVDKLKIIDKDAEPVDLHYAEMYLLIRLVDGFKTILEEFILNNDNIPFVVDFDMIEGRY